MKTLIQKWLGITTCDHKCTSLDEFSYALGEMLQKFTDAKCVQCSKPILAHYGGFYRNFDGLVFCSHNCIDNHKEEERQERIVREFAEEGEESTEYTGPTGIKK